MRGYFLNVLGGRLALGRVPSRWLWACGSVDSSSFFFFVFLLVFEKCFPLAIYTSESDTMLRSEE